jgi:hypothetical protein
MAEDKKRSKLFAKVFRGIAVEFPRYSGVQKGVHSVVLEHNQSKLSCHSNESLKGFGC